MDYSQAIRLAEIRMVPRLQPHSIVAPRLADYHLLTTGASLPQLHHQSTLTPLINHCYTYSGLQNNRVPVQYYAASQGRELCSTPTKPGIDLTANSNYDQDNTADFSMCVEPPSPTGSSY